MSVWTVGFFRNPPVVRQPGDALACAMERIGAIENRALYALLSGSESFPAFDPDPDSDFDPDHQL